jgi:hypothetical protein
VSAKSDVRGEVVGFSEYIIEHLKKKESHLRAVDKYDRGIQTW